MHLQLGIRNSYIISIHYVDYNTRTAVTIAILIIIICTVACCIQVYLCSLILTLIAAMDVHDGAFVTISLDSFLCLSRLFSHCRLESEARRNFSESMAAHTDLSIDTTYKFYATLSGPCTPL